ncbi:hypothetical protein H696_01731 [Fonticula alba]|uniref:Uncharacterized protein n=1 Tax=Fonticula alba TaxID=691883 RepID=A0A058ZFT8_FONAL|nr:hypothetical protein H696_01731 [Fonticula alba]KCV72337.1 hypothetical protein H696_01731 [Fonticula alba]|eukprot:XP_009493915.1 hypothetical protein H696_01731 [Fonticula alba]
MYTALHQTSPALPHITTMTDVSPNPASSCQLRSGASRASDPRARIHAWRRAYSPANNLRRSLPGLGLGFAIFASIVAYEEMGHLRK